MLFPVLRRQNEGVALGLRHHALFEAGVITVGILSLLSIVTLQQEGATGAEAGSLVTVGSRSSRPTTGPSSSDRPSCRASTRCCSAP